MWSAWACSFTLMPVSDPPAHRGQLPVHAAAVAAAAARLSADPTSPAQYQAISRPNVSCSVPGYQQTQRLLLSTRLSADPTSPAQYQAISRPNVSCSVPGYQQTQRLLLSTRLSADPTSPAQYQAISRPNVFTAQV